MNATIYVLTSPATKLTYVGRTTNVERRLAQHVATAKRLRALWVSGSKAGKVRDLALYCEMARRGPDTFTLTPVEECPREEAADREQHWVDKIKPTLNEINPVGKVDRLRVQDIRRLCRRVASGALGQSPESRCLRRVRHVWLDQNPGAAPITGDELQRAVTESMLEVQRDLIGTQVALGHWAKTAWRFRDELLFA